MKIFKVYMCLDLVLSRLKKYKLDEVETAHRDLEGRKIVGPAVIIP